MQLGDRMKMYENVWRQKLIRRMPVIIRIDGKAFHTYTKGLNKPFDEIFMNAMQDTMKYLVENIQGCKFGYCQSDEISLLLVDYDDYETEAWFDNNIQKMVSVSASMAGVVFNQNMFKLANQYYIDNLYHGEDIDVYSERLRSKTKVQAVFDARAFNLDKDEVCNYFIWRQEDCIKNAISMIAREYYSDKELDGINTIDRKAMLLEKDVKVEDFSSDKRFGSTCYYKDTEYVLDKEIPIFKEDRNYIENYVYIE